MRQTLTKTFRFEAAHFLPSVPEGHPCRRLHGHSYEVDISIEGEIGADTGWVQDYGELGRVVRPVLEPLDHNLLNAVPGLENPTSEILAAWIWERVIPGLPRLRRVTIRETRTSRCDYDGPEPGGDARDRRENRPG
jgi:6-pyruvoyltetrahydropterin/6-carboxytetrahydropterin synthase